MNPIDEAEIKRFLRSEVDQAALVAASDFHNIDDVVEIRRLKAEVLTLRERVAFLESPEVCAAAHDDVTECGYCQRDRLRAERDALRADAERGKFLCDEWHSTIEGLRVPEWIARNALRIGGVRKTIDAALAARGKDE